MGNGHLHAGFPRKSEFRRNSPGVCDALKGDPRVTLRAPDFIHRAGAHPWMRPRRVSLADSLGEMDVVILHRDRCTRIQVNPLPLLAPGGIGAIHTVAHDAGSRARTPGQVNVSITRHSLNTGWWLGPGGSTGGGPIRIVEYDIAGGDPIACRDPEAQARGGGSVRHTATQFAIGMVEPKPPGRINGVPISIQ